LVSNANTKKCQCFGVLLLASDTEANNTPKLLQSKQNNATAIPTMKRTTTMSDDTCHRVEAIGSWDHAIEPYDVGCDDKDPKEENVQGFIRHAFDLLSCRFRNGVLNDTKLREVYLAHTEEVVAGEKMAVNDVVHQDSFNAPC
jgi:hypothetical protein